MTQIAPLRAGALAGALLALAAVAQAEAPAPSAAAAPSPLTTLPMGKGLPALVRAGVYFVDVAAVDENEGSFTATVDVRLRWQDPRLRFPSAEAPGGFLDFRSAEAETKLAEIWTPDVALANRLGEPSLSLRGLRLYPDGRAELMQRTTAKFSTPIDVERYPFDHQKLRVELASRREGLDKLVLDFRQDDLDFSRAANGVALDGWTPALVDLRREPEVGWYGESHARMWAALTVTRQAASSVGPIFIPLFASLLIPLLAIWLNEIRDGEFEVKSAELANIIIGGLFAVIALNFTVNSTYRVLSLGDNLVSRLFGLNYLTLGVSLVIDILLFRYNLARQLFGKHVQEEVFWYLAWSVPVLAFMTAVAFVFVAKM